jgi:hypothetical protein
VGAVLWDIYRDLKDADYRLIGTAATMSLLARSGIGPCSVVVFHGYAPALGFWLMKSTATRTYASSTARGTPGGTRATR